MKLLIDTEILKGLEDAGVIQRNLANLRRKSARFGIDVFVHEVSKSEIMRDEDRARRTATLSKLRKFEVLDDVATPDDDRLTELYGAISDEGDRVDAKLLDAVATDIVDFLVTEDDGLHRRAIAAGLAERVFTVTAALDWIRRNFEPDEVFLPSVEAVKAYSLDFGDPIFDELRTDYVGFDDWVTKCRAEHRDCWVIKDGRALAGLIIRKDEAQSDARTDHQGPKILKICTLKVAVTHRGQKLGEQLLKQVLWHAQRNAYDLVYLTMFPRQPALVRMLERYGFRPTVRNARDETLYEKPMGRGPVRLRAGDDALMLARMNYPRFADASRVSKFVVPIRPTYHETLFPEFATTGTAAKPGNTIRKVYLCRAPTNRLRPGDLIVFYMTKCGEAGSQSLTTLGIVESCRESGDLDEVRRWTANRSVFSEEELRDLVEEKPAALKVIDFLLVGHFARPVPLHDLERQGILNGAPQSITILTEDAYRALKPSLDLGFRF